MARWGSKTSSLLGRGGRDLRSVGGDVFGESIRCINWGGHILTVGFTSGATPRQ